MKDFLVHRSERERIPLVGLIIYIYFGYICILNIFLCQKHHTHANTT